MTKNFKASLFILYFLGQLQKILNNMNVGLKI